MRFAVLCIGSALVACHLVFPYGAADRDAGDRANVWQDTRATDAPSDGAADKRSDTVAADGIADAPTSADSRSPDAAPLLDSSTTTACVAGAMGRTSWPGQDMVLCTDPAVAVDQCAAAATLCNAGAGWRLCTASEYRVRGGISAGSSAEAWIQGCIRSGGNPHSPIDALCACDDQVSNLRYAAWYCDDITIGTFDVGWANVGLATHTACMRVGDNQPETEAFWKPKKASSFADSAMCCR